MAGFDSPENKKGAPPPGENGLNLVDLMRGSDRTHTGQDKTASAGDTHTAQARSFIQNDNLHTHLADQQARIANASPDDLRKMMEDNTKLITAYQQHMSKLPGMIDKMQT